MLYQLQSVRNVENVYSKLLPQTVTKVYFQVDQLHTILLCLFYLSKYEHQLQYRSSNKTEIHNSGVFKYKYVFDIKPYTVY